MLILKKIIFSKKIILSLSIFYIINNIISSEINAENYSYDEEDSYEGEDDDEEDLYDNENLDDDVENSDLDEDNLDDDYEEEDYMENEDIYDPLEKINRKIFEFNNKLDEKILNPLISGNNTKVPKGLKQGVTNFSHNFFELPRVFNYTLQGNGKQAGTTLVRFLINTAIGFFGIVDIAEKIGFEKNLTNFGDTLKKWGVPPGAFIVLPILGPTSMRGATSTMQHLLIDRLSLLPCKNWNKTTKLTTFCFAYIFDLISARSSVGQLMAHINATSKDKYKTYRSVVMDMEK